MSIDRNNPKSIAYGYLQASQRLHEAKRAEATAQQSQKNATREMEELASLLSRITPSQLTLFTFDEDAVMITEDKNISIVKVKNGADLMPKPQHARSAD